MANIPLLVISFSVEDVATENKSVNKNNLYHSLCDEIIGAEATNRILKDLILITCKVIKFKLYFTFKDHSLDITSPRVFNDNTWKKKAIAIFFIEYNAKTYFCGKRELFENR